MANTPTSLLADSPCSSLPCARRGRPPKTILFFLDKSWHRPPRSRELRPVAGGAAAAPAPARSCLHWQAAAAPQEDGEKGSGGILLGRGKSAKSDHSKVAAESGKEH